MVGVEYCNSADIRAIYRSYLLGYRLSGYSNIDVNHMHITNIRGLLTL